MYAKNRYSNMITQCQETGGMLAHATNDEEYSAVPL